MRLRRRTVLRGVGGASVVAGLSGCLGDGRTDGRLAGGDGSDSSGDRTDDGRADGPFELGDLTVAVTTSTYDTGLLDELHAAFESAVGARVRAVAGGSGENVRAGERGDVDVVMAHAPGLEDALLRSGHGINRRDFVTGDFVVVGPPDDPADVAGADEASTAFEQIAAAEARFLSRGDGSGTHRKERAVWEEATAEPAGDWYMEAGQGMGETLTQAAQQRAYLLSVRGTYVAMRDRVDLGVFVEGPVTGGDPTLDNPYGVFVVNPAKHPSVNYELAMLYVGFLTGRRGQALVGEYAVNGDRPFVPNGLSSAPNFDQFVPGSRSDRE